MSNPHARGKQTNAQGQYGLSKAQGLPYLGLRSSISSSGAFVVPANAEGAALPQKPLPGSALDLNVQAKMDVRHADPDACFTSTQRYLFPSLSTGVTHLIPSDLKRHRYTDPENGSGSTNWFPNCSTSDSSSKSIPHCDYDTQVFDKQAFSGFSDASYCRQLAIQILRNYGLDKEVLDELILYPEDKTTAENLPHVLHQIYLRKTMKSTAVGSAEPQPSTSESGMGKLSSSADPGMRQGTSHSLIIQERKVFDSGCLDGYTTGLEEDIGHDIGSTTNNGGNVMEMDTYNHTSDTCESLQASTKEGLSTALISSHDQMGSVVPPSSVLTKQLPANEDKELRMLMYEVAKSFTLKEAVHQSTPQTQQITNLYIQDENSDQPNDVNMGGKDYFGTDVKSKTRDQGSEDAKQVKKQQTPEHIQQMHQQQGLEALTQMGVALLPQAFTAVTPSSLNSCTTDPQFPVLHSEFITSDPCLSVVPPSHQIPGSIDIPDMLLSKWQSPAKKSFKVLPSLVMIQDYAGATPRTFSHICSLCKKECANMKVSRRLLSVKFLIKK